MPESASSHPPVWKFDLPIFHAETRATWRAWLEMHHGTRGVWLCSWRNPTGRPRCPYPDAVEEALCFGWIDSTTATLDEARGIQLFTPRRAKSSWTRLNRQRVHDMEVAGLMTDAGRRAIEVAKANGYWQLYDQVEDLVEPDDLAAALDAHPQARAVWDAMAPSRRKQLLWPLLTAATPATRTKRINQIITSSSP